MSYNLHCFGCGEGFHSKEEVIRNDGKPYCVECASNWEYQGEEEEYDEQELIDNCNVARYGEC